MQNINSRQALSTIYLITRDIGLLKSSGMGLSAEEHDNLRMCQGVVNQELNRLDLLEKEVSAAAEAAAKKAEEESKKKPRAKKTTKK